MAILAVDEVMLNPPGMVRLLDAWGRLGACALIGADARDPRSLLVERKSGLMATVNGGAVVGHQGLVRPDGTDDNFVFPSVFGCTENLAIACVFTLENRLISGEPKAGCLVKVGTPPSGIGIGLGDQFSTNGNKFHLLVEGLAWSSLLANRYFSKTGLNFVVITSYGSALTVNLNGTLEASTTQAKNNPSGSTYINGYAWSIDSRYPQAIVHAVGLWNTSTTPCSRIAEVTRRVVPFAAITLDAVADGLAFAPTLPADFT